MALLTALVAAFLTACFLTWRFLRPGSLFRIMDQPNDRSLHSNPTPRSGGLAFLSAAALATGALAVVASSSDSGLFWVAAGAVLLAVSGAADDLIDLSPRIRLVVQLLSAGTIIAAGLAPTQFQLPGTALPLPPLMAIAVTLGYVVWMTNLYNFMDGMDGFAGGMAVIGFGSLAAMAALAGDPQMAAINAVIAASVAGFLVWNFPPARIFMGDAGSSVLGFLAAAMTLAGAYRNLFPVLAGIIVFSPFIVDATFTLLRRAMRGERVWVAHREHVYQRLVQAGWSHRKTVLRAYLLMLICSIAALGYVRAETDWQWTILLAGLVTYLGIIALTLRHRAS